MINRNTFLLLVLLLVMRVQSQEKAKITFGKGLINFMAQDSSFSVKFAPRIQFLTTSLWNYDNGSDRAATNFMIRRARLKFNGFAFSPRLQYKIEIGLSNRDISGISEFTKNAPRVLMDAVIKWNFYKNFVLWAGQTKLPGNVERVISSANLQLVDRSMLNAYFNIDRDIGFQLRHHFYLTERFLIREIFSLSQGEGRNVVTGNLGGLQYTGRLEFLPFGAFKSKGDYKGSDLKREQTPKLSVGVTYDFNKDAVRNLSNRGLYMLTDNGFYQTDISTLFIDTMFKYRGFSFMGEFSGRKAKDPVARNEDGSETGVVVQVGNALNLQGGYLFKSNWEIAGRYTAVNLDKNITGKGANKQYTLGLSKFIVGHKLKVQTDLSYQTIDGMSKGLLYRLQFDLHF